MGLSTDEIENQIDCACPGELNWLNVKYWGLWLLVNISRGIDIISGGSSSFSDVSWIPTTRVAFGAITNAYVVALNDLTDKVYLSIQNNTDTEISVSFGGSVEHVVLPVANSFRLDPGSQGRVIPQAVYIKWVGAAPTAGEVVISAYS